MPEIVEGDLRESGALEKRCEGSLTEVGGVDEVPDLSGEDEALILVDAAGLQLLGIEESIRSI